MENTLQDGFGDDFAQDYIPQYDKNNNDKMIMGTVLLHYLKKVNDYKKEASGGLYWTPIEMKKKNIEGIDQWLSF